MNMSDSEETYQFVDQRANAWSFIIFGKGETLEEREKHLSRYFQTLKGNLTLGGFSFAYALHDKDVEDGKPKAPHIHLILWLGNKTRTARLYTLVRKFFAEYLTRGDSKGFDLDSCLSVAKCNNKIGLLRYLVHLDDPEKYQYNPIDVVTSHDNDFGKALEAVSSSSLYTVKSVWQIAKDCNNFIQFLCCFDFDFANSHIHLLKTIWASRFDNA